MSMNPAAVRTMRNLKRRGKSIKDIAAQVGCSKSTASLYCRDLYEDPQRRYPTQKALRKAAAKRQRKHRAAMTTAATAERRVQTTKSDRRHSPPSPARASHRRKERMPCEGCGKLIVYGRGRCAKCKKSYRQQLAKELKIKKSGTWEIRMIIRHPIDDERSLP